MVVVGRRLYHQGMFANVDVFVRVDGNIFLLCCGVERPESGLLYCLTDQDCGKQNEIFEVWRISKIVVTKLCRANQTLPTRDTDQLVTPSVSPGPSHRHPRYIFTRSDRRNCVASRKPSEGGHLLDERAV